MSFRADRSFLDFAIWIAAGILAVAAVYLAYTFVAVRMSETTVAPTSRAIENLRAAVEQDPQNVQLRVTLGEAFAAAGQQREAYEQFSLALEIDPDDPNALAGMALLLMFQEDWETAEEYWLAAIAQLEGGQFSGVDQRLEQAYHQMGATLMELYRYEEAVDYLRAALRMRRTAADTHYLLAISYGELGSRRNERFHLEEALTYDPAMPEANYAYAFLLLDEGDPAGAAEHFRISADNAPPRKTEPLDELRKFGSASRRMEEARRLERSDPSAALTEARIARALDPEDVEIARFVAQLFERTWDRENAIKAWRRVLELVPNDPEAITAIDRLRAE